MDEQIGKLRWRCRRGMKELDLLVLGYLDHHYPTASAEESSRPSPTCWSSRIHC